MWTIEDAAAAVSRIIRYRLTAEGSKTEAPIYMVDVIGPTLSLHIHMGNSLEKNIGRVNAGIDQVIHDFKSENYPGTTLLPSDKMLVVDSISTSLNSLSGGYITMYIKEIDQATWADIIL